MLSCERDDMKRLTMIEFEKLDSITKISYAYKVKMNYYKFYGKRPALVGWRYLDRRAYCPLCKQNVNIVSVGFMNHVYYNKVIDHPRCEYCLLKLPVMDKKILKLLDMVDKPKELPIGQMTL